MAMDEPHDAAQPRTLSEEETAALLRACADPCECAALGLLAEAGLRPREVCGLRVGDMLHDAVRVRGKDGHERTVALRPYLSEALHRCLHERDATSVTEGSLLFAAGGRPFDIRALGKVVRAAAGRVGLSERLSPHALRATAARRGWRQVKQGGTAGLEGETQ